MQQKTPPDQFKQMILAEARTKAQDQAAGASARFVESLINAGQIKDITVAVDVFEQGTILLQDKIANRLAATMLAAVEEQIKHSEKDENFTPAIGNA